MTEKKKPLSVVPAWVRSARMIAWGFFGVRKRSEFEEDTRIHPLQIVLAGLVAVFALVLALLALVHWVAG